MKAVLISDTHGQHESLALPSGDLLLHAGDVSGRGGNDQIIEFLKWFEAQEHKYKVFIAGNHDFFFEKAIDFEIEQLIPGKVHYLNDSGVTIEGYKIWGSPVQPRFFDWAFNRDRGADIKRHWDMIPVDTDILITHGPPYGILDETDTGLHVGCEDLLAAIDKTRVKLHVFGHIHEAYGSMERAGRHYVNASVLDLRYKLRNKPMMVEI